MNRIAERYRDFWPYYVGEHARPATRWVHFAATTLALGLLVVGVVVDPWYLLAAPVVGYGPAWAAHALIERNRPATFRRPLLSLIGDLHMCGLMWAGRMNREIERLAREGRLPAHTRLFQAL
ncbi:MAG: Mpo1-like protein [Alphaproteobacteria bacterium]